MLSLQASPHHVTDAAWSPLSSTVLASVTTDGRLDLWDLEQSTLDPVATVSLEGRLSSVGFAAVDPVVVAGGVSGEINVFRVHGVASGTAQRSQSAEQQRERLMRTIEPSPLAEIK